MELTRSSVCDTLRDSALTSGHLISKLKHTTEALSGANLGDDVILKALREANEAISLWSWDAEVNNSHSYLRVHKNSLSNFQSLVSTVTTKMNSVGSSNQCCPNSILNHPGSHCSPRSSETPRITQQDPYMMRFLIIPPSFTYDSYHWILIQPVVTSALEEDSPSYTCPLERAISRDHARVLHTHSLPIQTVTAWDHLFRPVGSMLDAEIGPAQSAHLYRERSSPLHHEYALVCFSAEGISPSWMRLERAARLKHDFFQRDSIGPVFGTATLRETITFGGSKEALIGAKPADQLASVTLTHSNDNDDENHDQLPLFFGELFYLASAASEASPRYSLLTYNCRWFSRRLILDFAHRLKRVNATSYIATWQQGGKEQNVSYDDLLRNIRKDLFGGRPLVDERTPEIRALQTLQLARAHLVQNQNAEALKLCITAIPSLRSSSTKSPSHLRRLAGSLELQYCILIAMGKHVDALSVMQESRKIMIDSQSMIETEQTPSQILQDQHANATSLVYYSNALANVHAFPEALGAIREAIGLWRQISSAYPTWTTSGGIERRSIIDGPLAKSLYSQAYIYLLMNTPTDALESVTESIRIYTPLYATHGLIFCAELGAAWQCKAATLNVLERVEEACVAISESVTLYNRVFVLHPDVYRTDLQTVLFDQALYHAALEQYDKACAAMELSAKYYTHYFRLDPDKWRTEMANVFLRWSSYLVEANRIVEAIDKFEATLQLYRALCATDYDRYAEELEAVLSALVQLEAPRMDEYQVELAKVEAHIAAFSLQHTE